MSHDSLHICNESRRAFLLGFGAGSLLLAFGLPTLARAAETSPKKKYGGEATDHGLRDDPHLFVEIAPDGTVTVVCIRSEMGQGVRTSVA
ncbi:hypothetical protein, partial [Dyella sp.]|uniref:hypothetical protein n=1 Tax=Dyella sp. TaxID=1869338 RepID=UPI002CEBE9F6|nr:hypothetical protein [Dyella sp.]